MTAVLSLESVEAGYGDFQALFGVSIEVETGETVAIIGANGAGKTTLLRTVMGQVSLWSGVVRLGGKDLSSTPPFARVRRGLALVPEGRRLFPSLSVEENLQIGAYPDRPGEWSVPRVVDLFPLIGPLLKRPADVLSGGEQQAVAIGRALMGNPTVLLLDEVSLGLAPIVVRDLYAALPAIREGGTTLIVVEQDITLALDIADTVYCVLEGRVSLSGPPSTMTRDAVTAAYFGVDV
jgi:branched-chain amino acid transport system ATP-binding protein